ncbi:heat shock protein HspQ [Coraliomargarita algicola]|uniref:heat shock protein HspQ n=1 Tax=Coraliomargarita algicola TaxID=3092156 RepID=UPI0031F30AF7
MEGGAAPGIYYDLGLVVIHQIYGYRGVIVAVDPRCMAGETWYLSNKTQPPREQPWYHVLVHDSGGLSTYVAQSNLAIDTSGKPISHPRINCYFSDFIEGRYKLKTGHSPSNCGS